MKRRSRKRAICPSPIRIVAAEFLGLLADFPTSDERAAIAAGRAEYEQGEFISTNNGDMKWGLAIANRARRAMRTMPRQTPSRSTPRSRTCAPTPYGGDIRFLKGTDRVLRRRVGDWRILYETNRGVLVVNDVERRDSNTY